MEYERWTHLLLLTSANPGNQLSTVQFTIYTEILFWSLILMACMCVGMIIGFYPAFWSRLDENVDMILIGLIHVFDLVV